MKFEKLTEKIIELKEYIEEIKSSQITLSFSEPAFVSGVSWEPDYYE